MSFADLVLRADSTSLAKSETAMRTLAVQGEKTEVAVTESMNSVTNAMKKTGQGAEALKKTGDQVVQTSDRIVQSTEKVVAGSTAGAFAMRNTAMQLSQVAQMGQVTGNYVQALAIQLPDMAMGFGTVGIAAGVLAGITLPLLVNAFMDTGQEIKAADDRLDNLVGALHSYRDAATMARTSTSELREEFGQYADDVARTTTLVAQAAQINARTALSQGPTADLISGLNDAVGAIENMDRAAQNYLDTATDAFAEPTQVENFKDAMDLLTTSAEEAAAGLGLSINQVESLDAAFDKLDAAQTVVDIGLAAQGVLDEIDAMVVAGLKLPPALAEAVPKLADMRNAGLAAASAMDGTADSASTLPGLLGSATSGAYGLAGALSQAAGYAAALRSAISGLEYSNIAIAAENAALTAGETAAAARATGQLAAERAKLAPMLGSEDAILRGVARSELERFETVLDTNVALEEQRTALIKAASAAGGGGGGGGLTETLKEVKRRTEEAKKAAEDYAAQWKGVAETGVDGLLDEFLTGFQGGMSDIVDLFENALREMASLAIRRPIRVALGLEASPSMIAAGQAAAPGAGGGFLGTVGAALGGFGTGFGAGFQSFLTGGFGAIGTAIQGIGTATSLATGLGTALGAIAGPLAVVGVLFSAFKTKTEVLSSGLQITVRDMDTLVQTFQNVKKTRFFGLSRSYSWKYADASSDVADPVSDAVFQLQTNIMDMAGVLGIADTAFAGFVGSIRVNTQGLSEDQALAEIQEQILLLGDRFAELAPGVLELAKEGEGAATTIQRLSQSLTAVNSVTDTLGLTFVAVGLQGADAASKLVDAFGGLDAMSQATSAYYQAFYSEAERAEIAARQVQEALDEWGITMPTTRDAFRALVNSQDLSTEAGRQLFTTLIGLSGVMDALLPRVGNLSSALSDLLGDTETSLSGAISANEAAQREAAQAAKAWADTARTLREYIADMRGASAELISVASGQAYNESRFQATLLGALTGDMEAARSLPGVAGSLLESVAGTARTGAEAAVAQARVLADLERAAKAAELAGSEGDRVVALLEDQRELLQELSDHLASGLPLDPEFLEAIEAQLGNFSIPIDELQGPIDGLRGNLEDLAAAIRADTAARAAAEANARTLGEAQKQLEALVGQRGGAVGALQQAVSNIWSFDRSTGGNLGLNGGAAVLEVGADGRVVYKADAVYGASGADLMKWRDQFWNEGGLEDQLILADRAVGSLDRQIQAVRDAILALGGTPTFAGGGMHRGGLRIVGERGPELEMTGPSRIYNQSQLSDMLGGGQQVAKEIRELKKEVATLRDQNRQLETQSLLALRKLLRINEDWDNNGLPKERV